MTDYLLMAIILTLLIIWATLEQIRIELRSKDKPQLYPIDCERNLKNDTKES